MLLKQYVSGYSFRPFSHIRLQIALLQVQNSIQSFHALRLNNAFRLLCRWFRCFSVWFRYFYWYVQVLVAIRFEAQLVLAVLPFTCSVGSSYSTCAALNRKRDSPVLSADFFWKQRCSILYRRREYETTSNSNLCRNKHSESLSNSAISQNKQVNSTQCSNN